jgi:hypothetical protein
LRTLLVVPRPALLILATILLDKSFARPEFRIISLWLRFRAMRETMAALDVNETADEMDGATMPKGAGSSERRDVDADSADRGLDLSAPDAAGAQPELEQRKTRLLAKVPSDKIFAATSVMQKPNTRS